VRSGPRPFVVVTATRWHEDDLIGRLVEQQGRIEDGGLWEVINLPAIAVENDALGRKPGTALWPEMYDIDLLLETRAEVGPYVWDALYQGNPSPPEGTILLRQWWNYYDAPPAGFTIDSVFMSWDMSFKESEGADFVVGQVWAIVGSKRFLLDQVKDRMSFTRTVEAIRDMKRQWPMAMTIYIEDTANGPAVIDALSDEISGIVPVTPQGSKVSRAHACTGMLKAGNVYLPKSAPWLEDFVRECAVFPQAPNDDQVDAFTQAMIESGAASGVTLGSYRPGDRAGQR
jgi:predicted phage terminase large subunit-like protein